MPFKLKKLKLNPGFKPKPLTAVAAFNFAKKVFPQASLCKDASLKKMAIDVDGEGSGEIENLNNIEATEKLCSMGGLELESELSKLSNESETMERKEKLIEIAKGKLSDRKTLPETCDSLEGHLNVTKGPFFLGEKITTSDFLIWAVLNDNGRWRSLKKEKSRFGHLCGWFERVEKLPEFERAKKEFESPAVKKNKNSGQINKNYGSLNIGINESMRGKVVTRFPPEPSGFLHIGHVKAAMLNSVVAKMWDGKMIVRFDDTNPSKEKEEYVDNILRDLKLIEIPFFTVTHTSDYFEILKFVCEHLIKEGRAFVDDSSKEIIKKERMERKDNVNRNNTKEKNLAMWKQMVDGEKKHIVRIKIDMKSNNGTLRDPTIYRCNTETPHLKTKMKYKVYPTYDLAIVVSDTIEGVTHCFRSDEYCDRSEQYKRIWSSIFKPLKKDKIIKKKSVFQLAVEEFKSVESPRTEGIPKNTPQEFLSEENLEKISTTPVTPKIKTFSRVNFVHTILSKRKLKWFVGTGRVGGWDDPRLPTVQGMIRRGLTVEGLRNFILSQGFSLKDNLMEWDLIWSTNKKVLDPIAPRYTVLSGDLVRLEIEDGPDLCAREVRLHPKNPEMGVKEVFVGKEIFVERVDAEFFNEGKDVTLIEWGNVTIDKINLEKNEVKGHLNLEGDVKKTMKITWLAETKKLVKCVLVKVSPLITVPKMDAKMNLEDVVAEKTWEETTGFGDHNLSRLSKGHIIQLQRKGFAIVEKEYSAETDSMTLILVPDSRSKPMVVPKGKEISKNRK